MTKSLRIFSFSGVGLLLSTMLGPIPVGMAQSHPVRLAQSSALPEELEIDLLTKLSDQLSVQIAESSCAEFNELLDGAQADANDPNRDESSIINQVLKDVQTNPKLRAIILDKLGEPLLGKILDCNLVPLDALSTQLETSSE